MTSTSLLRSMIRQIIVEDTIPGNAPGNKQVHVFDFDDTLGVTSNANGVMLYKDGKPVHKSKDDVKAWLNKLGVSDKDILTPGMKSIPERDGGIAVYLSSAGLAKVQREFPSSKQGVTTGFADKVNQDGETILIDFTPSSSTDIKTTKPIKSVVSKLKAANAQGSDTIVITARKATGKGIDFSGNEIDATNSDDMNKFLSDAGAKPTDGVLGVTGQNKGNAIINKYIANDETAPEEIHFYDDLKKNTDEVEDAVAEKVPSELYIYGPGEFNHNEADPETPNKKFNKKKSEQKMENKKSESELIMERWTKLAGIPSSTSNKRSVLRESPSMFYGKDLNASILSQIEIAVEDIMMDLEDYDVTGAVYVGVDQLTSVIENGNIDDIAETITQLKLVLDEIEDAELLRTITQKINRIEQELIPQFESEF